MKKKVISLWVSIGVLILASIPVAIAQTLTEFQSGFTQPTAIVNANDGSKRLFVVEKSGLIRVLEKGKLSPQPFVDLRALVSRGTEQGLLSLTFHPDFATNKKLYLLYTNQMGDVAVVEYQVSKNDPNRVALETRKSILEINHRRFANHNGGTVLFGPDKMLYISVGDGGGAGDPEGNGQDRTTLLGTLLRIDVDRGSPYTIPETNPFAKSGESIRGEIFAYGLRNPWKFSFDLPTQRLFLADVGQNAKEEVNLVRAGQNFGWNIMEGTSCFQQEDCQKQGLTMPIHEYGHDDRGGRSITGGYLYRGKKVPTLCGKYVFADFVSGRIWAIAETAAGVWKSSLVIDTSYLISTFGLDEEGELYVADYATGIIYHFDS